VAECPLNLPAIVRCRGQRYENRYMCPHLPFWMPNKEIPHQIGCRNFLCRFVAFEPSFLSPRPGVTPAFDCIENDFHSVSEPGISFLNNVTLALSLRNGRAIVMLDPK